jgi:hypothetical protein
MRGYIKKYLLIDELIDEVKIIGLIADICHSYINLCGLSAAHLL